MIEADARRLLRNWPAIGQLETWITEQSWQATPDGWAVLGELQGRLVRLDIAPGGLRITASPPSPRAEEIWVVTASTATQQA